MGRQQQQERRETLYRYLWGSLKRYLRDERGEIGGDIPQQQTGANADPGGWDSFGGQPAGTGDASPPSEQQGQPAEPGTPSEALNPETPGTPGEPQGDENLPFHNHPRWQEMVRRDQERTQRLEQIEADLELANERAQWYEQQLNQALAFSQPAQGNVPNNGNFQQQAPQQQPQQQPQQIAPQNQQFFQQFRPGELPADVIGPSQVRRDGGDPGWRDQEETARFIEHRVSEGVQHATQAMEQAYQNQIRPVFNRVEQAIDAVTDMLLENFFPDYQDAIKAAYEDAFLLDQNGNVIQPKNLGLVQYWTSQPLPKIAAYRHGARKLAPSQIKKGTKQATTRVLKQITSQPRGPIEPSQQVPAQGDQGFPLTWDNYGSQQSEHYLHRHGMVK